MDKRKVQVVIFKTNSQREKEFLILLTNERRGNFWQSVTGGVEKNEEFETAAFRETLEETSCSDQDILRIVDLKMDFEFHDQWGNDVQEKIYFIEVKNDCEIKIDPSEHQDFKWVNENLIDSETVKYAMNLKAIKKCIEIF